MYSGWGKGISKRIYHLFYPFEYASPNIAGISSIKLHNTRLDDFWGIVIFLPISIRIDNRRFKDHAIQYG